MSEPLKSTHIRLTADAHAALTAIADLAEKDNAEMARLILEEALLGRVHALNVTAEKYTRLGLRGISRESGGLRGIPREVKPAGGK